MSESVSALDESYNILVYLCKLISKFSKDIKYSLGEKIENYWLDAVAEISLTVKTFGIEEKIFHIQKAKKDIEIINILIRVCHDIWKISHEDFKETKNKLNDLQMQLSKREISCQTRLKSQNNLINPK